MERGLGHMRWGKEVWKRNANKYNVSSQDERTWVGVFNGKKESIVFHSKKEMNRFCELILLKKLRAISKIELQPKFICVPGFTATNGKKFKPEYYIGDFMYKEGPKVVCEDVKGYKTVEYKRKIKRAIAMYPDIKFIES